METTTLKVLIAANNALVVNGLRHSLERKYGSGIRVTCSYDLKSCLRNIGFGQDVVVLDEHLDGVNVEELHRKIKTIDPAVFTTIHTSDSDVSEFINELIFGESGSVENLIHKLERQMC